MHQFCREHPSVKNRLICALVILSRLIGTRLGQSPGRFFSQDQDILLQVEELTLRLRYYLVAEREILISDVAGLPPDNSLIAPFT